MAYRLLTFLPLALCMFLPSLAQCASILNASPDRNGRLQAAAGISGTAARLVSPNGGFWLTVQTDGNLVLYRGNCASNPNPGCAVWSTKTSRAVGDYYLAVQDDGNLVLYRGRVSAGAPSSADNSRNAYWNTRTNRPAKGHYFLSVENDGNVVLREGKSRAERHSVVWSIR
jgi:hypothetical protein